MADIKWIKVAVDMFEDSKIEFIRSLPEGDAIIVTWIQMLSIAGQSNMGGYLMVAEGIPYTEQLLSNKLRRQPVLLQFALETLSRLKMIDIEDGPFHITKWEKHQNVEGMEKVRLQTSERVKKHRSKEKEKLETLPSNATVTLPVTQSNATELELDLELKKNQEEQPKTAMDAYFYSFKKWNYTGQIQGYISELMKRGYTDSFVREIFLAMGEFGANPDVNYMRKTAEDWIEKGIYTLVDAKSRREGEKKKVAVVNQPSNQAPKEHIPDPEILRELRELRGLREAN